MIMATKRSSKAQKSIKNRSKRVPSVKRLEGVRPLKMSMVGCPHTTQ
jgi:hypothetical protein